MAALAELERAIVELGFKALRVVPWLWNRPPDDRLYYPLYARCVELGHGTALYERGQAAASAEA